MKGEGAPAMRAAENCFNLHSVSADISEGKSYCAGRENCQSHGQRSEDLMYYTNSS